MIRSQLTHMPEYFDRYINQCDDVELLQAIQISIDELNGATIEKWKAVGDKIYAPGKWTIKDILQHVIDTERIFCYRALAFARGEKQHLPGYEEDDYAKAADAGERTIESLVEELIASHRSTLALFKSFSPAMMERQGMGFKGEYSVASIGFILPGHQRWHFNVIREKYFPLLKE